MLDFLTFFLDFSLSCALKEARLYHSAPTFSRKEADDNDCSNQHQQRNRLPREHAGVTSVSRLTGGSKRRIAGVALAPHFFSTAVRSRSGGFLQFQPSHLFLAAFPPVSRIRGTLPYPGKLPARSCDVFTALQAAWISRLSRRPLAGSVPMDSAAGSSEGTVDLSPAKRGSNLSRGSLSPKSGSQERHERRAK